MIEIKVNNDQVDRAIRDLKRKLIKEGLFKELSRRKFNIKPSLAKRLKRAQAEKYVRRKSARNVSGWEPERQANPPSCASPPPF